mmetsp:Transcript_19065/g.53027  ORF Transcript_19065/g.53027 Transcript_19065/m.53027 type:complete len:342 (-) Transcript_19065:95-1120(-)
MASLAPSASLRTLVSSAQIFGPRCRLPLRAPSSAQPRQRCRGLVAAEVPPLQRLTAPCAGGSSASTAPARGGRRFHSGTASHGISTDMDPYTVLGLPRGASKQDITTAYHALALRWHPDRNPGDAAAEECFKEVAAAYQALRNSETSAQIDFAQATGISIEEAMTLFKEVFGADTLGELAAVIDRAEAIQLKAQREVHALHPDAERALQSLAINSEGVMVVRTTMFLRGGRRETHEHELSAEEAKELAEMGLGMARLATFAARDVATKVATEVGQSVAQGVANSPLGLFVDGLQAASRLAEPHLPTLPSALPSPFSAAAPPPGEDAKDGDSTSAKGHTKGR